MADIRWNQAAIKKAAAEAVQAAGPTHIAEIQRLTSGLRCGVHGTTPVYTGPWPIIAFEDFCCDDLERRVRSALSAVSWLRLNQAA
jgi:hypothetical protein